MKILTVGHRYELDNFERKDQLGQVLQFIEKVPVDGGTELETLRDGTTNEDVLRMLLDRLNYLQSKFPCRENAIAITHVETALLWLEYRTTKRVAQQVEGKQIAHES